MSRKFSMVITVAKESCVDDVKCYFNSEIFLLPTCMSKNVSYVDRNLFLFKKQEKIKF